LKLVKRTTQFYIGTFAMVLMAHAGLSYFSVNYLVHQKLEKSLIKEKRIIAREIIKRDSIPVFPGFGENELVIQGVSEALFTDDQFQTKVLFSKREEEPLQYYELRTYLKNQGEIYELRIRRSLVQTHELIYSLVISSILSMVVLLLVWVLFYRRLNRKLWQPFYDTLRKLKSFEFRSEKNPHFGKTDIQEFKELNEELNMLTDKLYQDYQGQKHFVENASHELQTPLAIIKTQLELLLQSDHIQEQEVELVASALDATDRLTRINKSLITISRIENLQYADDGEISLNNIINQNMVMFQIEADSRGLEIIYSVKEDCVRTMNDTMAHMMVRNLIQNAIRHNIENGGKVWINLDAQQLAIKNTGKPLAVPTEKLFERFFKNSEFEGSIGLGLPIVKQICELYDFELSYTTEGNLHCFQIKF
jgi:signal transduction histidine kinase